MRMGPCRPAEPGRVPKTLPEIVAAYERIVIIKALQLNGFSRKRTAASLGVSTNFLWRRMSNLRMDFSAFPRIKAGRPKTLPEDSQKENR